MSKKLDLKGKFHRASGRLDNTKTIITSTLGSGIATAVGALTLPIDGGLTLATGIGGMATSLNFTFTHDQSNYIDYQGTFTFDEKTYNVTKTQWQRLKELNNRINTLVEKFNSPAKPGQTVNAYRKERTKLQKKIQSLTDYQINILKSKNVTEHQKDAPKPQPLELKINKRFDRGLKPN